MRDFPGAALIRRLRKDSPHPGPQTMARDLQAILNDPPVKNVSSGRYDHLVEVLKGPKPKDPTWRQHKMIQYDRGNATEGFVFDLGDKLLKVAMVPSERDGGEFHLTVLTRDK